MKQFTITKNDAGQRLDKYLIKTLKTMPKSLVYKSLRKKKVKINGKRITDGGLMLHEGDVLEAYINDEFFELKDSEKEFPVSVSDEKRRTDETGAGDSGAGVRSGGAEHQYI